MKVGSDISHFHFYKIFTLFDLIYSGSKKQIDDLKSQLVKKDHKIKTILRIGLVGCGLILICCGGALYCNFKAYQSHEEFRNICLDLEKQVKKAEHHMDAPKKTANVWNAMEVGFISPDAIIEKGAIVEPGAFIFPKAVIRSGSVGKTFI